MDIKLKSSLNNILYPDLYDIELVFNGYTRANINTEESDGKARYQRLHDEYAEELKHNFKEI